MQAPPPQKQPTSSDNVFVRFDLPKLEDTYCRDHDVGGTLFKVGVPYTVRSFIIYDNDVTLTLT